MLLIKVSGTCIRLHVIATIHVYFLFTSNFVGNFYFIFYTSFYPILPFSSFSLYFLFFDFIINLSELFFSDDEPDYLTFSCWSSKHFADAKQLESITWLNVHFFNELSRLVFLLFFSKLLPSNFFWKFNLLSEFFPCCLNYS